MQLFHDLERNRRPIVWPHGKRFAFTVFDDTDLAHNGNFEGVYGLLRDCGLRTTKSVWPLSGERQPSIGGATCQDPRYRDTVLRLQSEGFEIGYHNTTYHGVDRQTIRRGLDRFRELFGADPKSMANHADSSEAIYWGEARLSGVHRVVYQSIMRGQQRNLFGGHRPGHTSFWGDLCRERIKYVRNFTTRETNTLRACPIMPYHDPDRPFVRSWYASTEGAHGPDFVAAISEENQDRLEAEGGACIMYTHFASGFSDDKGRPKARFRQLIERLSRKNGWFVPVAQLLEYLERWNGGLHTLTPAERSRLERRWLLHKLRLGKTT